MKLVSSLRSWLRERYPMDAVERVADEQLHKPLPTHVGFWHTFGSLALFLFINQVVTGILLMVYYRPTTDTAFESLRFIMAKAHFGWLIRGLHAYGATLMILCMLVHMLHSFFAAGYKKPRELTWVLGAMLLGCTVTFGFTGYLLPWNQLSYWATTVGTEIAGAIPLVGNYIKLILRGGEAVTGETLARFFVLHVVILPWVLTALLVGHLLLMRVQGLATMDRVGEEKPVDKQRGIPFFPNHVLREGVVFCLLIGVLLALIVFRPVELGEKANPLETPEGIKPEWYFLSTYQLLKYFPKTLGLFVSFVPPLLLLFWPFLDRNPERRPGRRPVAITLAVLAMVGAIILGILGHLAETTVTFRGRTYQFDMYGRPELVEPAAPKPAAAAEPGAPAESAAPAAPAAEP